MILMWSTFQHQLDYLLFTVGTLALFAILHHKLWRNGKGGKIAPITWALVIGILAGGSFLVELAGRRERREMEQRVAGYAPTYAREMEVMGHSKITAETGPNDPNYLRMIEAEKRWLGANLAINDIYTLRKLSDGRMAFMVDSETDYNRNSAYDEEREQRTKIGEVYESDLTPTIEKALNGQPAFMEDTYTDRWGTWVSAVVPIRDKMGKVEAALGVDFDASSWVTAFKTARFEQIAQIGCLILVIAGASGLIAHQRTARDLVAKAREQEAVSALLAEVENHRQRLSDLLTSVPGVVWEAWGEPNSAQQRINFVSDFVETMTGYNVEEWLATPNFWLKIVHPDDRARIAAESAAIFRGGKGGTNNFRWMHKDGHAVWVESYMMVICDESGAPTGMRGVTLDVTMRKQAEAELERAEKELREASRQAGMAEVATSVLHNVGNVLNSVNISIGIATEKIGQIKTGSLSRVATLLRENARDLPGFFANNAQGMRLPQFLGQLAEHFTVDQKTVLGELDSLRRNVEHINEIVAMQQSYATAGGVVETLPLADVIEDALRMNSTAFERHGTHVVREFETALPPVTVDRNKVLLILVNLIRNAKYACDDTGRDDKIITLRTQLDGDDLAKISVCDNGIGISPENLTRIFEHGFTTRKNGHGFGLHSSALAASDMGGSLHAHSDGAGQGAIFTLSLPLSPQKA